MLNELDGDRHLLIQIGSAEAFALAASLDDMQWGRPMTYQFMAELVRSLRGCIREVRLDAPESMETPNRRQGRGTSAARIKGEDRVDTGPAGGLVRCATALPC